MALGAGRGAPASAQDAGTIPLTTFGDMLVDAEYGHIFVSGGPSGSTIEVFDFDGNHVATIPDEAGASGLVIGGGDLYAMIATGRIDRIDRATLQRKTPFPEYWPPSDPNQIAWAAGRIWYGGGSCDDDRGVLVSLDPESGITYETANTAAYRCAGILADESIPNTIFTFEADYASPNLTRWDIGTDPPTAQVSQVLLYPPVDAAFAGGGALLYLPQGPLGVVAYDARDLLPMWAFGVSPGTAVATEPDGWFVAMGTQRTDPNAVDAVVDLERDAQSGFDDQALTFAVPDADDPTIRVVPRGIGFLPSGKVAAVLRGNGDRLWLETAYYEGADDARKTSLETSADPSTVEPGDVTHLTVEGNGFYQNETRVNLLVSTRELGVGALGSVALLGGSGEADVRPLVSGSFWTSVGSFRDSYPTVSDPAPVFVRPDLILDVFGGRLAGRTVVYPAGSEPVLQASLQPALSGRYLEFVSQIKKGKKWVLEDRTSFGTDARGLVSARFVGRAGATYRVRLRFGLLVSTWRKLRFEDGGARRPEPRRARSAFVRARGEGVQRCASCS